VARRYGALQVALVLAALGGYELLRAAMEPDWPLALRHAREVVAWERAAHVAWEAPLQGAFLRAPALVSALDVFYLVAHFALTGLFFVWLYRRSRPAFGAFRNAFLAATAVALAGHAAFPTAPPRLAGVGIQGTLGIDVGAISNPVAAIPSLHAGWALGVGVGLVLHARRPWKLAGALYPAVVLLTIVVTGNHFVIDAVAGMAVMAVALGAVVKCRKRRGVEQSGSSPGS
jgi:hypothetical protein